MTTKEQERKALAQIEKIVEGLGEDSYIGTAFAGCFRIAHENIENDWACSMKERAESAEKKLGDLGRRYDEDISRMRKFTEHLEKSRNDAQTKAAENFQEAQKHAMKAHELEKTLSKKDEELASAKRDAEELAEALKAKDIEIMKLKAKLFDLLVK